MKRSEMIDNIACILVVESPYPQAIDINKIASLSEKILNELESRGMIPPENPNYNPWINSTENFWDEEKE